jgi:ADP-ribosylglycohydrolase
MLGAIAGDIIGSVYEAWPIKTADFPLFQRSSRFTDDTVLTVAAAQAILTGEDYASALREVGRRYPNAGYGGTFIQWLHDEQMGPYNSWGNGSAMRVSPIGWAYADPEQLLAEAAASAAVSHNHPEGIKGAQAVALAIYRARTGASKEAIREEATVRFHYDLSRTLDEIRPDYSFDVSCQGSVPEAIIAFLESDDYETAVRLAISLGGDSDTLACIAGAIAEAFYGGVPDTIAQETRQRLPTDLLTIIDQFQQQFTNSTINYYDNS